MKQCQNTGRCSVMIDEGRRKYCSVRCRAQGRKYRRVNPMVDPDEVEFLDVHLTRGLLEVSRHAYALKDPKTPPSTTHVLALRDKVEDLLKDAIVRDRMAGMSWRRIAESLGRPMRWVMNRYAADVTSKRNRVEAWPAERLYSPLRRWAEQEFGEEGVEIVRIDFDLTPKPDASLSLVIHYLLRGSSSNSFYKSYEGEDAVNVIASLFHHALRRAFR